MPANSKSMFARFSAIDAVGLGVGIVLTLVFIFGLIEPLRTRDRQSAARLQGVAAQKQRASAAAAEIESLTREIEQLHADIATARLRIRPQTALNERLAEVIGLTSECSLSVTDTKPAAPVRAQRFAVIPIRMTGRGTYQQCATFLHMVNVRLPDVGVRNFRLTGHPEDRAASCEYELELSWLTLPEQPPTTTEEIASTPLQ